MQLMEITNIYMRSLFHITWSSGNLLEIIGQNSNTKRESISKSIFIGFRESKTRIRRFWGIPMSVFSLIFGLALPYTAWKHYQN